MKYLKSSDDSNLKAACAIQQVFEKQPVLWEKVPFTCSQGSQTAFRPICKNECVLANVYPHRASYCF